MLWKNWTGAFLDQHPHLRSRFVPPLDKTRVTAEDAILTNHYFDLLEGLRKDFGVADEDEWNIDEKGVIIGYFQKFRVICSRANAKAALS